MADLTKIFTPFGLLDEETQKALKEYQGPIQFWGRNGTWATAREPSWYSNTIYRAEPQPQQLREKWEITRLNGEALAWESTKIEAEGWRNLLEDVLITHWREVLP